MCRVNGGIFIKIGQHIGALDLLLPKEYVGVFKVITQGGQHLKSYRSISDPVKMHDVRKAFKQLTLMSSHYTFSIKIINKFGNLNSICNLQSRENL